MAPGTAWRPLAPVAANGTNVARAVAAKPNNAGGRRAPAMKTSKPPAKKARKRKDDSESEMELDDDDESEEESEEESGEEESEEESGEEESGEEESGEEESGEEDEGVERGSEKPEKPAPSKPAPSKPAPSKPAPKQRTMRGAAAAAAILVDPADEKRTKVRTQNPRARLDRRRPPAALDEDDDELSDEPSEAASESASDEPVADSEEEEEEAVAGAKAPGDSPRRRVGGRVDVNRASVNVAGASARAGVEVDAVRDGRRKSEVVASVSPDDFTDSEDELAMVSEESESEDESNYSESE